MSCNLHEKLRKHIRRHCKDFSVAKLALNLLISLLMNAHNEHVEFLILIGWVMFILKVSMFLFKKNSVLS